MEGVRRVDGRYPQDIIDALINLARAGGAKLTLSHPESADSSLDIEGRDYWMRIDNPHQAYFPAVILAGNKNND